MAMLIDVFANAGSLTFSRLLYTFHANDWSLNRLLLAPIVHTVVRLNIVSFAS